MFFKHKISLIQVLRLKNVSLIDWKLENIANSWKFLSEKLGLKSAVSRALNTARVWLEHKCLGTGEGISFLPWTQIFALSRCVCSCLGTALTVLAQFRGRSCAKSLSLGFFSLNTSATTSGRIVLGSCLSFCMHSGRGMGSCFHTQGENFFIFDPLKGFQHRWQAGSSLKTVNLPLQRKVSQSFYNPTLFGLGFGTVHSYPCQPVCVYRHIKQWQIKLLQAYFV